MKDVYELILAKGASLRMSPQWLASPKGSDKDLAKDFINLTTKINYKHETHICTIEIVTKPQFCQKRFQEIATERGGGGRLPVKAKYACASPVYRQNR